MTCLVLQKFFMFQGRFMSKLRPLSIWYCHLSCHPRNPTAMSYCLLSIQKGRYRWFGQAFQKRAIGLYLFCEAIQLVMSRFLKENKYSWVVVIQPLLYISIVSVSLHKSSYHLIWLSVWVTVMIIIDIQFKTYLYKYNYSYFRSPKWQPLHLPIIVPIYF